MKQARYLAIPVVLISVLFLNVNCSFSQQKNEEIIGGVSDTSFITTTKDLKSGQIPKSVFTMTHLKHLSIKGDDCDYREIDDKGNDITQCWNIGEIPKEIGSLKELISLSFQVNSIERIPKEISQLKHLRSIDLSDNLPLTDINGLCDLESLEDLSLCGCNISVLPDRIGELKNLKSLCLAGTKVGEIELKRVKRLLPGCDISF